MTTTPIPERLETVAWSDPRYLTESLVTRASAESALRALQGQLSAARAECERLRAVMCEALTWVQAAHRDKPFNDPDICGEMVSVRVTGLAMLAEEVRPGCRAAAMQAWFEAARTSQGTPTP